MSSTDIKNMEKTEKEKQREKIKELYKNCKEFKSKSSEQISRAIFEFNKKLRNGATAEEAYGWLNCERHRIEQEFFEDHGFHMDFTFNFLYPETIGYLPDTYEEWQDHLKKTSRLSEEGMDKLFENYKEKSRQELIDKYGEEKVQALEKALEEFAKNENYIKEKFLKKD